MEMININCNNINLKKGSTGNEVKELQTKLKEKKYYTYAIDGVFGEYTLQAVKAYQKNNKLIVDGIFGPVTCKKLNTSDGIYINNSLCERSGGDCLGQITSYHCGPHALKQALRKLGITGYSESTIGRYAGTTTAGTGHAGLNTAIEYIARQENITLVVQWINFSELGSKTLDRFKKLIEYLNDKNKTIIWHELYRSKYGHYSLPKTININNNTLIIPNSLGNKCTAPAYCGYMETRTFNEQEKYFRGISQKSICVITKK